MKPAWPAELTLSSLNPDVIDGDSSGDVVVHTIKQGFFLVVIGCLLRYLCLYSTAGVAKLRPAEPFFIN